MRITGPTLVAYSAQLPRATVCLMSPSHACRLVHTGCVTRGVRGHACQQTQERNAPHPTHVTRGSGSVRFTLRASSMQAPPIDVRRNTCMTQSRTHPIRLRPWWIPEGNTHTHTTSPTCTDTRKTHTHAHHLPKHTHALAHTHTHTHTHTRLVRTRLSWLCAASKQCTAVSDVPPRGRVHTALHCTASVVNQPYNNAASTL